MSILTKFRHWLPQAKILFDLITLLRTNGRFYLALPEGWPGGIFKKHIFMVRILSYLSCGPFRVFSVSLLITGVVIFALEPFMPHNLRSLMADSLIGGLCVAIVLIFIVLSFIGPWWVWVIERDHLKYQLKSSLGTQCDLPWLYFSSRFQKKPRNVKKTEKPIFYANFCYFSAENQVFLRFMTLWDLDINFPINTSVDAW